MKQILGVRDIVSKFLEYAKTGWDEVVENFNTGKRKHSSSASPPPPFGPDTAGGHRTEPAIFSDAMSEPPPKRVRPCSSVALHSPTSPKNPFREKGPSLSEIRANLFDRRATPPNPKATAAYAAQFRPLYLDTPRLDTSVFGHHLNRPRRSSSSIPPVVVWGVRPNRKNKSATPHERYQVPRESYGNPARNVYFPTQNNRLVPAIRRPDFKKRRETARTRKAFENVARHAQRRTNTVSERLDPNGRPQDWMLWPQDDPRLAGNGPGGSNDRDDGIGRADDQRNDDRCSDLGRTPAFSVLAARKEEAFNLKMSQSKKRSSQIQLEIYVAQQQRLQNQRRREEAQRSLDRCSEFALAEDVPEEEPPIRDRNWHEVYWKHTDGDASRWDEKSDADAIAEREQKVSVEGSGKGTCMTSPFAPLTGVAIKRLRSVMADGSNQYRQLSKVDGCVITGEDLRRLKPENWLNDEIVNAYVQLLSARGEEARSKEKTNGTTSKLPNVKAMNSFFYAKLVEYDRKEQAAVYKYQRVRRWTKKFDSFSYDLLLVPINQENVHWTLGVIDFKTKTIYHLDSMATGGSPTICDNLLMWVRDEAADKGKRFEIDEWQTELRSVPVQRNTDDCGVFLCKFADFLCRGWENFTFSQTHMQYFRSRIAHELLMGRAT